MKQSKNTSHCILLHMIQIFGAIFVRAGRVLLRFFSLVRIQVKKETQKMIFRVGIACEIKEVFYEPSN